MKNFTKILFLVVSLGSCKAEAALSLAFAAARGAFQAGRFAVKHGAPVIKEVAIKARPVFKQAQDFIKTNPLVKENAEKLRLFVKENPRETAYIGGGAALGYYTSGDGVVNTVVGTGLGAAAGAYGVGMHTAHTVRIGLQAELALAGQKLETITVEAKCLRDQLAVTQKGYAAAVAKLKDAANPAVDTVVSRSKKVLLDTSLRGQVENFWTVLKLKRAAISEKTVSGLPTLVGFGV
jgi:hypothetical protein